MTVAARQTRTLQEGTPNVWEGSQHAFRLWARIEILSRRLLGGPGVCCPLCRRAEILDWFHHYTIPRTTLAKDYRTGDVMPVPPIPYGEYAKDYYGAAAVAVGHVKGLCSVRRGPLRLAAATAVSWAGRGSRRHGLRRRLAASRVC